MIRPHLKLRLSKQEHLVADFIKHFYKKRKQIRTETKISQKRLNTIINKLEKEQVIHRRKKVEVEELAEFKLNLRYL